MSRGKGCCGEPGCARKQPLGLYLSDFSNQVYAVTRWRVRGEPAAEGREHRVAVGRHDVTAQMEQFVRANPEWLRSLLPGNAAEAREESLTEEILRNAEDDIEPGETPQDLAAAERDEARAEAAVLRELVAETQGHLENLAAVFEQSASLTSPSKKSEIEQGCALAVRGIADSLRARTEGIDPAPDRSGIEDAGRAQEDGNG